MSNFISLRFILKYIYILFHYLENKVSYKYKLYNLSFPNYIFAQNILTRVNEILQAF